MCFVSKQEEKAVIKVPGAYMFTVCPKVEQELKTCLKKGCKKVQVDLAATEILTTAGVVFTHSHYFGEYIPRTVTLLLPCAS